jgi:RimJ/RimL family protein N-acetyltransferase
VRTARLVGHPIGPDDLDDMRTLFQDLEVAETMNGTRSDAEVAVIVERDADQWARHGYGQWAWQDAVSGAFVGRGGLRALPLLGRVETEVGYALLPRWWRLGLATEIAAASVRHAFDEVGLEALVAMTLPTNVGSRRVMEAVGFTYDRDITHAGLPHVLYRLARADRVSSDRPPVPG